MNRRTIHRLIAVGALSVAVLAFGTEAKAGWGTFGAGYYGSSYYGASFYGAPYYGASYYGAPRTTWAVGYGGYGYGADCCGNGCYDPCYTSCRPGLLTRIANCWRNHRYARRNRCCAPRWGVGYCCTDPCCDTGCDSCGSSTSWEMGEVYDTMEVPSEEPTTAPIPPRAPAPATPELPADPALPSVLPEQQTSHRLGNALLTVQVPEGTRVFVNGVPTKSTGMVRRYVSRNLAPGYHYTYEVRAEANIDGKPVVETKTVHMRAGQTAKLAFDVIGQTNVETALTLNVPRDAKVFLAGNEAPGTGIQRTFRTTKLSQGNSWTDYAIRVQVDRNGKTMTKEQTITLQAGDSRALTFQFGVDRLASAR